MTVGVVRTAASGAWRDACVIVIPLCVLAIGHAPLRALQMAWMAAPAWILWFWPTARFRQVRRLGVGLWLLMLVFDAWIRAFVEWHYSAALDSSLVTTAIANATSDETREYVTSHFFQVVPWLVAATASTVALAWGLARPPAWTFQKTRTAGWIGLLILALIPQAFKPTRRLHPAVFWFRWTAQIETLKLSWTQLESQRQVWLSNAKAQVEVPNEQPHTVVVVLTDSVNRDNLQLYGYPRATSPQLLARQERWGAQWVTVRDAWSTEASTVPALQSMWFHGPADQHHVLALARAAGFKVWWISNHDDLAVKNQHGRVANELVLLNRFPGRSTRSLDDVVLPALNQALRDPASRKLIVLHLLGAHQHYSLRFPSGEDVFSGSEDAIQCHMRNQGREAWLRRQRDHYDAALRFHEGVVAASLDATAAATGANPATWLYVSDHGQEVGHTMRHAGHSAGTASGYRIPLILWRNAHAGSWPADLSKRSFRADWWPALMADVLQIRWPGVPHRQSILHGGYEWVAPHHLVKWMNAPNVPMDPACSALSDRP